MHENLLFSDVYQINDSFFLIFNFLLHCVCETLNLNIIKFDCFLTTALYFVTSRTFSLFFNS